MFITEAVPPHETPFYLYRTQLKNRLFSHPEVKGSVYPRARYSFYDYRLAQTADYLFALISPEADACILFTPYTHLHLFYKEKVAKDVFQLFKKVCLGISAPYFFLYRMKDNTHVLTYNDTLLSQNPRSDSFLTSPPRSVRLCQTQIKWSYAQSLFRESIESIWYSYVTPISGLTMANTQIVLDPTTLAFDLVEEGKVKLFVMEDDFVYALLIDDPPEKLVFTLLSVLFIWLHRKDKTAFHEVPPSLGEAPDTACLMPSNAFLHLVCRQGSLQKYPPLQVNLFLDKLMTVTPRQPTVNQLQMAMAFVATPNPRSVFDVAQFCCWLGLYAFVFSYHNQIYYSPEFADRHDQLFVFCVTEDHLMAFLQVEQKFPSKIHVSTDHIFKYGKLLDCFWPLELNTEKIDQLLDSGDLNELVQYVDKPNQPGSITQFISYRQMLMVADRPLISSPYIQIKPLSEAVFPTSVVSLQTLYNNINITHAIKRLNILAVHTYKEGIHYIKLTLGGMTHTSFYMPIDIQQCNKQLEIYYNPPDKRGLKTMAAYEITETSFQFIPTQPELIYTAADETFTAKTHYDAARPKVTLLTNDDAPDAALPPVTYDVQQIRVRHPSEKFLLEQMVPRVKQIKDADGHLNTLLSAFKLATDEKTNLLDSSDFYLKFLIYGSPFTYFSL